MPKEFRSLISLQQAKSIIFNHLPTVQERSVALGSSLGCILAEKVISSLDVPGFSRASMDGYAVLSQDTIEAREEMCIRDRHDSGGRFCYGRPARPGAA